jgi:adenylate cyclase, class 2
MKEIEVKILDIDVEDIRNKLLTLGAEKIFDGEVHAFAFDLPNNNFHENGSFVRVRKVGDKAELCFKGKKEDSQFKSQEEIEVNVSEFMTTVKILENIGLKKFHDGKKHRESYKIENTRFEIDNWEKVDPFLEIEAPTEEIVKEYVEKLGFTMEQAVNWSYLEIEKHYDKNGQEN